MTALPVLCTPERIPDAVRFYDRSRALVGELEERTRRGRQWIGERSASIPPDWWADLDGGQTALEGAASWAGEQMGRYDAIARRLSLEYPPGGGMGQAAAVGVVAAVLAAGTLIVAAYGIHTWRQALEIQERILDLVARGQAPATLLEPTPHGIGWPAAVAWAAAAIGAVVLLPALSRLST